MDDLPSAMPDDVKIASDMLEYLDKKIGEALAIPEWILRVSPESMQRRERAAWLATHALRVQREYVATELARLKAKYEGENK